MLPGPSFIPNAYKDRFYKVGRTSEACKVAEFLGTGNLFWYSLPSNPQYMDMGPRVVLEAMAAGLPILADNWGGVVDRVTEETGWLCTKNEQLLVIKEVTSEILEERGRAAKQRANDEFKPEAWIQEILD
jgi:glycosyltransferase involved in cell wall biosynthesis